eukprot:Em0004g1548a
MSSTCCMLYDNLSLTYAMNHWMPQTSVPLYATATRPIPIRRRPPYATATTQILNLSNLLKGSDIKRTSRRTVLLKAAISRGRRRGDRAVKRQKYEDNSAAIKASERNRYWNDPAVRLAKRAAERKRYRRGHRTTTIPPKAPAPAARYSAAPLPSAASSSSRAAPTATSSMHAEAGAPPLPAPAPPLAPVLAPCSAPTTTSSAATLAAATTTRMAPMAGTRPPQP